MEIPYPFYFVVSEICLKQRFLSAHPPPVSVTFVIIQLMAVSIRQKSDPVLDTFDCLGIPVFVVNKELEIVSSNLAACRVFQYPGGGLTGRAIDELVSIGNRTFRGTEYYGQHPPGTPVTRDSDGISGEAVCRRQDGRFFTARVSFVPQHTRDYRLVVIQDISDQKKLQQRAFQRTKELSVFTTFASVLTSHRDMTAIIRETLAALLSQMEADAAWLYLYDEEKAELLLKAQKGLSKDLLGAVSRLKPGEGFNGKVLAARRPLLVKDASADPRVTHRDEGMKSMAGVPISSRGNVLGVLGVSSGKNSFFTAMDIQLLSTIGSQLGVAIENTKLIGQLREKMKQIELTGELSGIINSSLSIGTVFRIMVAEIGKLIDYSRASLLIFNERENNLLIFALDTKLKTVMKKGIKAPLDGTSAGWVVRNNMPWINRDLEQADFPLDRKLFDEGIRSTISIPLFKDRMLGVFNLDSTEKDKYSGKDLHILLPAAKHISIALENALLFEEISREKREWEKTFDAITDMVWIEDGGRRVIRANRTLLEKTGLSSVDIPGKKCGEVLDRIGISSDDCLCSDTVRGQKPSFRELRGTGGSIFHFWAYPLIDEEGRLYAIVHYLKDVTSQKRLEQQLIRSERLASLGTLVAGIAHEVNNPLGIIAGYSEALIERAKEKSLLNVPDFADFPEYLATIHQEIFRCKDILRSLLDFARPSCGTFRQIDINELIKEVILLVNHKAKRLSHSIALQLNRDLPKISADPGSLRQLFMNIIINSIYFTPEKGSIVIFSSFDRETDTIRVAVQDSGAGIIPEMLGKVFDPFFTTKPVGEGTGLGLAICHKIVEEHGGSIDVESDDGSGTTFIIRLPANGRNDKNSCRR
jgi:two-component system NtrC family sensor kinase